MQGHKDRIRLHLMPYFGRKAVAEITSGMVQNYRVHRMTEPERDDRMEQAGKDGNGMGKGKRKNEPKPWKSPAANTIHNEVVTLSMVLKTAQRHGWLEHLPDLSDPKNKHFKWHAEQLHDFVLFMANTGLRSDEMKHLEFRDVEIVEDEYSDDRILEIEVRGKRGVGYCKSMPGAVRPFERLRDRERPLADASGDSNPEGGANRSPPTGSSPTSSRRCSTAFSPTEI